MFANQLALLAVFAATVVSAAPGNAPPSFPVGQWDSTTEKCSVGKLQCCDHFQSVQSANKQGLFGPVGVALGTLAGQVGANCNPISALIGASGNNCNASPACCSHDKFNGLITVGCSPINGNI